MRLLSTKSHHQPGTQDRLEIQENMALIDIDFFSSFRRAVWMTMRCMGLFGIGATCAWGGNEEIHGFHLQNCTPQKCFNLNSPVAYRSEIDSQFFFPRAILEVRDRFTGQSLMKVFATDGSYDPQLLSLTLRGVKAQSFKDVIIDLDSGSMLKF